MASSPATRFLELDGRRLEWLAAPGADGRERPALVLLHEGLGSARLWGGLPGELADATGCRTVAYSRWARPLGAAVRPADAGLPPRGGPRLAAEGARGARLERAVLVGHSDGATIALLHAGAGRWPLDGIVVMAPHSWVEDVTLAGIRAAGREWREGDLAERLRRHHDDADAVFRAWHDTWLSPDFRSWTIADRLAGIRCPVPAVQGEDDPYATMAQLDLIAARATARRASSSCGWRGAGTPRIATPTTQSWRRSRDSWARWRARRRRSVGRYSLPSAASTRSGVIGSSRTRAPVAL